MRKNLFFVITLLTVSVFLISCGKSLKPESPVVTFLTGNVTYGSGDKKGRAVKVSDRLTAGDVIVTGANSVATVQVGSEIILRLLASSSLTMKKLVPAVQKISLEKGTSLFKVEKLAKGREFSVSTKTALAAVRGTRYSVSYNPDKKATTVAVATGRVYIENISTKKGESLGEKKSAVITEKTDFRPISKVESLELEKLDAVPFVRGSLLEKTGKMNDRNKLIKKKDAEIDKKINAASLPTLSELRAKYGRIDVVTTYQGKVYRGVITSRGRFYRMVTPAGPVFIDSRKVKRTGTM